MGAATTDESKFMHRHSHVREFFCGGTAAAINIVLTFIPNKIMFRQQLYGTSTIDAWASIREDGWIRLYRGVGPPLLQAAVSKSIMFGLYTSYLDRLRENFGESIGGLDTSHFAAVLSGTSEAMLTPFERVQTLLQTTKFNAEFNSMSDVFVRINAVSFRENYRGLTAILMRNAPSNAIFFGMREHVREMLPATTTSSATVAVDFASGAMLGAFLSTLFFPLNGTSLDDQDTIAQPILVAKTRMQSVYGPHERYISVVEALKLTYHERGSSWARVYRGVHINFARSLVTWGIINSAYEKLMILTE
ncbi:unnamed protein product [Aphanomyces euteiches]|nr:hypothetical protein LEN26_013483 [Aphanomyces euteiches]KAH9128642.1 hypothetical protein AeMF1_001225 [Aphanomyces euteiches]KAH9144465.1 hypothetical protein AeRB84_011592 [Aphanomyces euteiches]KAH9188841.1 hypothetical protein AeNC1_009191 [Aphanomyces euteiches]